MTLDDFKDFMQVVESSGEANQLSRIFLSEAKPISRSVPTGFLREIQYVYDMNATGRKILSKILPVDTPVERVKNRMNELSGMDSMIRAHYGIYMGYKGLIMRKVKHNGSTIPFMWRNDKLNFVQCLYASALCFHSGFEWNHNFDPYLLQPEAGFEFDLFANGEQFDSIATRMVARSDSFGESLWFDLPPTDVTVPLAAGLIAYGVTIFINHEYVPKSMIERAIGWTLDKSNSRSLNAEVDLNLTNRWAGHE